MSDVVRQLEIVGLEETLRWADAEGKTPGRRRALRKRVEAAHEIMSELPPPNELSFLFSGMCQTALPHSRPAQNTDVWERTSGRFTLTVEPGVINRKHVGVPYGPKARLILIHLQTEGVKSRTVNLGTSLSAFMRSLDLAVTGGKRGTISAVREQAMRIARCRFTMQWREEKAEGARTIFHDTPIVDGMEMWESGGERWTETVELSSRFYETLKQHAVPLDKRAIARLAGNSLGLDLYTLLAYRLPKLQTGKPLEMRWSALKLQIGADQQETQGLARRIRNIMPEVIEAYPAANVEITRHGLLLRSSKPSVPKTMVQGRLIAVG
ncbi:MAG: plasmid replication protein [Rhodospirillales bacterium]|nr:plasmid replication protein [Acetobacter sp.]